MNTPYIAHRGEPLRWPENSLEGFRAALEAGAGYIETDVQLTADRVAVLCHDPSTLKVTGTDLDVASTPYAALAGLEAGHPQRFGDRYRALRLARLETLVALLADWPGVCAFIELKQAGLDAHGIKDSVDRVMDILAPVRQQAVIISFNQQALAYAHRQHDTRIGWVLPEWSEQGRRTAQALQPAYLFCNRKRLPLDHPPLWAGPWQWVVYTVNTQREAAAFLARGFDLVETDVVSRLIRDLQADRDG